MAVSLVTGWEIGRCLADAGLIPKCTRRIVIDISCDSPVTVYYSTYAEQPLLDAIVERLTDAKFVNVDAKQAEAK